MKEILSIFAISMLVGFGLSWGINLGLGAAKIIDHWLDHQLSKITAFLRSKKTARKS